MLVYVNREVFHFDIKEYLNVFFRGEEITFTEDPQAACDMRFILTDSSMEAYYYKEGQSVYESCMGSEHPMVQEISKEPEERLKQEKRILKHLMYDICTGVTNVKAPWGILTGIRPTKIVFEMVNKYGRNRKLIENKLRHEYKLTEEKTELVMAVSSREGEILYEQPPEGISLYIGIPFCPSKCAYCSFTSYPIDKNDSRVSDYLTALEKEIKFTAKHIIKDKRIQSIYIGGGTPTAINELQLERLMSIVTENLDLSQALEFTVEAGRPDTITSWKLDILKKFKVTRISINPQTMNNETLKVIGRGHTAEEVLMAYRLAKSYGFIINMDFIVGLPGESSVDVLFTMEELWKMQPQNVTIHTLAIKRGSQMKEDISGFRMAQADEIENMLGIVSKQMAAMGLKPYYMYRQKNMVGNFENIGYAKSGTECYYNIIMIEELQTVLALGAGAITKAVSMDKKIERIENVKNVDEYIDRIDEMIDRKKQFFKGFKL